jgi:H+-transporting ATPase
MSRPDRAGAAVAVAAPGPAPAPGPAGVPAGTPSDGLTSGQAQSLLAAVGPNSMPDTSARPWRRALDKLWAPVPWMLEAAIVLELVRSNFAEAGVIAALVVFNAVIGLVQEGKAQATLAALKSRLALNASVRRDGTWTVLPSAQVVPGDLVKLSLGAVVAADVRIRDGSVLLDQSMLTGESAPAEARAGTQTYAGALVRRGEATAQVTAVLAAIPVALPATFTLASAIGARALGKLGVLPTRLSAVDEAANLRRWGFAR